MPWWQLHASDIFTLISSGSGTSYYYMFDIFYINQSSTQLRDNSLKD